MKKIILITSTINADCLKYQRKALDAKTVSPPKKDRGCTWYQYVEVDV